MPGKRQTRNCCVLGIEKIGSEKIKSLDKVMNRHNAAGEEAL